MIGVQEQVVAKGPGDTGGRMRMRLWRGRRRLWHDGTQDVRGDDRAF